MKIDVIGVTNMPNDPGVIQLKKSLIKYEIEHKIIVTPWQGFYTKVEQAYKYCQKTKADFLLFLDTHDTVVVGSMDKIKGVIYSCGKPDALFSAEKAIWPDSSVWPDPKLAEKYPKVSSDWKYLNSGGYLIKPSYLIELVESNMPEVGIDDQMYWAHHYLNHLNDEFKLDTGCYLFQTLAHDDGSSFEMVDDKFTNKVTKTCPLIIHGNGKAFQEYDYSYIYS